MGLFSRDSNPEREMIENVVGASTTLKGTLRSDGGVRIDGTFEGLIEVAGNVVVGETGRVIADISARNITVGGAIKGNVRGSGRLEILSTGQVLGDIAVAAVMIDEGGVFQGTSRMTGFDQRALSAPREHAAEPALDRFDAADSDAGTVEVTARPAGSRDARVREHQVHMPDLDLGSLNIEPVIPDVVIEDLPGPTLQRPSAPAAPAGQGNHRRSQPQSGNGPRRR